MSALRTLLILTALAAGSLSAGQAFAQACGATSTINSIAFPTNMDVLPGAAITSASSMTLACTGITGSNRVLVCVTAGNGTYPLSGGSRQMGSGANRILFNLYKDLGYAVVWDTSVGGTISVVLTRLAPSATIPYYGRVNAAQPAVVPAAYSTTISVVLARTAFFTGATPPCTAATITTTRTITSTGTVVSSCLTATASNMTFPGTSFFTANIDTTGTVNVTCTNTSPYHVRLDGGNAAATDPTLRKMTLGANQITYGLYRDAARSLPWGSTDSTNTLDGTGTAASVAHTVYGRIPPQASKPLGTYTDTIVVTISF